MFIKPQPAGAQCADYPRCNAIVAQQIAHKYANMNVSAVCRDLEENHHRNIAHSYLQDVSGLGGWLARAREELWEYVVPPLDAAITTIAVSIDGAYVLMRDEGYREAMAGNISLYDVTGPCQQRIQCFQCDRIREVADLAGWGDLMDTENRLRIVPVVVLLHAPLVVQKRRALREKNRERA